MAADANHVLATMTFLAADPLHEVEKPYELLYVPTDDTPRENIKAEVVHDIIVEDLRPEKGTLSLDRDGFIVADLNTSMS